MNFETIKFCSLGLGGNSCEYGNGSHSTWYLQTPEEIGKHYADKLQPGVICLDKRPALERNTAYAFASPMVNVDMTDGDIDRFGSRYTESDSIMLSAMKQTAYGSIIRAAEVCAEVAPEQPGPLDYVPISEYVDWWQTRGAVVYTWNGAEFV